MSTPANSATTSEAHDCASSQPQQQMSAMSIADKAQTNAGSIAAPTSASIALESKVKDEQKHKETESRASDEAAGEKKAEDESDDFEEDELVEEMDDEKENDETMEDDIIRAKWMWDGCRTLEEVAFACDQSARHFRRLHAEGWRLRSEVCDDYGFMFQMTPEEAEKWDNKPGHQSRLPKSKAKSGEEAAEEAQA